MELDPEATLSIILQVVFTLELVILRLVCMLHLVVI